MWGRAGSEIGGGRKGKLREQMPRGAHRFEKGERGGHWPLVASGEKLYQFGVDIPSFYISS